MKPKVQLQVKTYPMKKTKHEFNFHFYENAQEKASSVEDCMVSYLTANVRWSRIYTCDVKKDRHALKSPY